MVAAEFSTGKAYAIGDLVLHDGILYKFKAAHSAGAWNSAQVDAVDGSLEQELSSIISAYERAVAAPVYVAKIVFSATMIENNRYSYTFMNA